MSKEDEIKNEIVSFVATELGGIEEIESTEENCGSMWITTKDGKTYWIQVSECEPQED
jgi:coenzyme F420-reducing hydrogenase beta subunit